MRRHQTNKPMRRCIACRQSRPQDELLRFTLQENVITPDSGRPADGRGFYLCRENECIETAIKRRAFNRVCRKNVDAEEIKSIIEQALKIN